MRAIELFAGAGGLGLGVSRAGFTPIDVVEWDRWCCDTIRQNRALGAEGVRHWPDPREGDVRTFSFEHFEGKVDLVTGGPPCQPFSLGGRHRAHDDHRDMWSQAVRVVRETRPSAFIFENVKGLTRATFSAYVSYVVLQLTYPDLIARQDELWLDHGARLEQHHTSVRSVRGLSYNVVSPFVLNAANFGVPQKRERVFFVGFRSDIDAGWSQPAPTHARDALLWSQYRSGNYWDAHKVARRARPLDVRSVAQAARLPDVPLELAWRTTRDALLGLDEPKQRNLGAAHSDHRFQPGARSYPGHTGSPLDQPAKTLKAGVHGVPGGENMLRRADGSVRYFTIRESARLQTFPDDFVFHGSWSETMRQLGNAVPVQLAEIVARSVRDHLVQARKRAGRA